MDSQKADETTVTKVNDTFKIKLPNTVDECHKMINTLLAKVNNREVTDETVDKKVQEEKTKEEQEKLEKQRKFFDDLRYGAGCIDFIWKDLAQYGFTNRTQRKRLIREMMNKKFSEELIEKYLEKSELMHNYMCEKIKFEVCDDIKKGDEVYINNRKIFKVVEKVDGADFVKQLEEKKEKGELKENE